MGYLKAPKINTSARMTSAWASSELLYDTDQNAFYKGDGTTTGGVRLAEGDMASVLAVISALEARVSTLSASPPAVSVTSTELSAAIANVQSVINVVSNNISVVNAARVSAQNALSNSISVVSNAVSVVSNALSVETQTRSAQGASINNQISNLKSVVSALPTPSVTSAEILSTVSIIQTSIAAVSNAVSVVSNALSVETANRVSADNVLSNVISSLNSAHNVLSNQVSQALSLISTMNLSDVVSAGNATSLEIQTSGIKTPHVQFDPAISAPSTSIYSLTKDPDFHLLNYQFLSALGLKVPMDDVWAVKNQTGSLIPKGTSLRSVGTVGASGRMLVAPMIADGSISPKYLLGVAPIDIPNGSDSVVFAKGKIKKFNTAAWPNGTILYCDPATPGGFTSTEPTAPNLKLPIAIVIYSDATNGILAVRVTLGNRLREDHDIQFTSTIANGDLIAYNASAQRWENFAPEYATSAQLSAASAQAASAINVVSNALSVETASRVSADAAMSNSISNIVSALNAISAANSVTSAEVAAVLSNALSAVNVVSNALSAELVTRANADNALSNTISALNSSYLSLVNRVSSNSLVVSVTSNELSAVSAQAASAINVVSNAVSVVSNAVSVVSVAAANALSVANAVSQGLSVEIVNRTSADNVLSNQISVVSVAAANALSVANAASNAASVVSNALSIEIVNRISADNVLSNSISNTLSIVNVVSNAVSIVSVGLANEISARAAADTNILSIISVLTDRVSANSGTGGTITVSATNVGGASVKGLQSVINALSNRISAISTSVTSAELVQGLSVVSAQAASAINVVSALIANVSARNTSALSVEGLQSVINALSNRISVVSSNSGGGTTLSVATVSAWQNDYSPSGWGSGVSRLHLSFTDGFPFFTGLGATTEGHRVILYNTSSYTAGLKHSSPASLAANRFDFTDGNSLREEDILLYPNREVVLMYRGSAWRHVSGGRLQEVPIGLGHTNYDDMFNRTAAANGWAGMTNSGGSLTEASDGNRTGVSQFTTLTSSTANCQKSAINLSGTFCAETNGANNYFAFEIVLKMPSQPADATEDYRIGNTGFGNTPSGVITNGQYLRYFYNLSGGNWNFFRRASSLDEQISCSAGPVFGGWARIRILQYPDGSSEVWQNGTMIGRSTDSSRAMNGVTGATVYFYKQAGTTARVVQFDSVLAAQIRSKVNN